jgi:predicted phage terminase large subunit-like protein
MTFPGSPTTNLSPHLRRLLEEAARRGLKVPPETLQALASRPPEPALSFREFVDRVRPGYRWYRHCVALADVLQRVADGELSRVLVFMPPREGKSELTSRLFTAYYLYRHPERWVGLASYGAELAYTLSRAARDHYQTAGGTIRGDASAVKHWETPQGGGLWAAGVGGPATGKGFSLGVIDDPFKDAEEAGSDALRQKRWDWYNSVFYTRESPDYPGAIVVVQTRWNLDDLAGRMLAAECEEDGEPERWHVVCFDAIKDADPYPAPATCTVEPDWREPGEPLNPQRRPIERLSKITKRIGAYWWNALFQQRPRPAEGKLFKRAWLDKRLEAEPRCVEYHRHWDLAATAEDGGRDPDFTAGVLVGKTADDQFAVLDVVRFRGTPLEVDKTLRAVATDDRSRYGHVAITVEQEPGASGKRTISYLVTQVLAGFDVRGEPAQASKPERARALASQAEAGNVLLMAKPWARDFVDELVAFPTKGVHDDQVDAAAGALAALCETYTAGAF